MAMDFLSLNLRTILLCTLDDEGSVSSNSAEQQPSASRDGRLPAKHRLLQSKITECELNDLIRDFELPK